MDAVPLTLGQEISGWVQMLDNDLRSRRLRQEAADPEVGLILLDVVLGEGAHPDPASELAPAIREAVHVAHKMVCAVVVGTEEDPQGLDAQIGALQAAGALVFRSVQEAAEFIVIALRPPLAFDPFTFSTPLSPVNAINAGLESFHESVRAQGAPSIHVDWRPPAGGNERLMGILARLKSNW